MKRGLTIVLAFALLFVFSTEVCFAQGCGGCKQSKGGYAEGKDKVQMKAIKLLKFKDELGLSDDQVEKIKELRLKAKKESVKQAAEIEIIALDIKAMLGKDPIDTTAINALIDQKYELKKAKAKSSIAALADLKSVLTAAQMDKLKELYQKHGKAKEMPRD